MPLNPSDLRTARGEICGPCQQYARCHAAVVAGQPAACVNLGFGKYHITAPPRGHTATVLAYAQATGILDPTVIANTLGIHRSTVRQALGRLKAKGYLDEIGI